VGVNLFINIPVSNLTKSKAFWSGLGFGFHSQFADEKTACLVLDQNLYAMLLSKDRFQEFTAKTIVDAHRFTEMLNALQVDSKEEVDRMVSKAISLGGREARQPQDHKIMYERSFEDLDGHIWEIFWMDLSSIPKT